jgi:hypothetical protein
MIKISMGEFMAQVMNADVAYDTNTNYADLHDLFSF